MKIPFRSIAKKITGISTPIGGISWEPPALEADIARKLIAFLEDKRVLYTPFHMEIPFEVNESVLQIRKRLTNDIEKLGADSDLAKLLRVMRRACRGLLDRRLGSTRPIYWHPLSEFRVVFGICIAQIAVRYKIDLGEELGSMIVNLSAEDFPDEEKLENPYVPLPRHMFDFD